VAVTADLVSHTYPLKVVVDNPDGYLRPGMIIDARLVRRQVEAGISIPYFAMVQRENGHSVYVVENEKGSSGRFIRTFEGALSRSPS
jgi:membrane fusion protein (multidrug efflux system)